MIVPDTFRLKGKRWKVVTEPDLEEDGYECDGLCDTDARIIYLNSDLTPKKRWGIFLHEYFHAVVFEAHIPTGGEWESNMEDILAEAFRDAVVQLLKVLKKEKQNETKV